MFFLFFSVIGSPQQAATPDARKIMEAVYNQDTSRDTSWQGFMDVFDKKGNMRRKRFAFRKLGGLGNSKTLIRFVEPVEVRGVGLLSYNLKGQADRQWLYTPAIQRTRRIAPQERSGRFLGTDFTHEDMAERVLDDFTYRLIAEGETIDGLKTNKIEAKPVSPDKSQYSLIYIWVPLDVPYGILVEMYDRKGQKTRIYHASELTKLSNIWVAKRLEMQTVSDNTRTLLMLDAIRFNTGLKEDLFTLQSLEKADLY